MKSIPLILAADNDIELYFKLAVAAIFVIGWAVKSVSNLAKPKPTNRPMPPNPPQMPAFPSQTMPPPLPLRQAPAPPRQVPPPLPLPTRRVAPSRNPQPRNAPPAPAQRLAPPPFMKAGGRLIVPPVRPAATSTPQSAAGISLPALAALAQQAQPQRRKKKAKAPSAQETAISSSLSVQAPSQAPAATAASDRARSRVAGWINAGTVRSEFLLAEALRPPLALRESHR